MFIDFFNLFWQFVGDNGLFNSHHEMQDFWVKTDKRYRTSMPSNYCKYELMHISYVSFDRIPNKYEYLEENGNIRSMSLKGNVSFRNWMCMPVLPPNTDQTFGGILT